MTIKLETIVEFGARVEAERTRRFALPLSDPGHLYGFVWNEADNGYEIWWGGYDYWIDWGRINEPLKLLHWLAHLGQKRWEGMTAEHVGSLVEDVAHRAGWNIWGNA